MSDGSSAILCTRGGRPSKPCYVCGADSEFLCDWPVTKRVFPKFPATPENTKAGTCDKPMCERCRNNIGPDRDYCNAHFRQHLKEQETKSTQ